ncbi:MAG TPA: MFS transporter [Edaphobacter sp.]|nr:MFS transporter [Edaphobacter sp.]
MLAATVLGSSMEFIDGTVVDVALPALQHGLGATGAQVQWVVEAYALFLSALLLVGGALGDRLGLRRIFISGVVLFAAASVWCGLAGSIGQLIAARALQGIGGAMLVPNSLALVSEHFPPEDRGRAIGTWSGFAAMMTAVGPVAGGWLVQHGSWRWVFYINAPLAIVTVWIVLQRVPKIGPAKNLGLRSMDWTGAALLTAGLAGVTFALIEGAMGAHGVWIAGVAGAVLLIAAFAVERRAKEPLVPLELFRSREFMGANLLTFCLYAAFGGALFYLPLNLIQIQRYTPTQAGAATLPMIVVMFLLSRWSGGLMARCGARGPLVVGPLISACGYGLLAHSGVGEPYGRAYLPAVLLLGLGMSVSVAPLTTVVLSSVEEWRTGAASGVNNAVSQVAALLALAVFAPAFFHAFSGSLEKNLAAAQISDATTRRVMAQEARLGAIETADAAARRAVDEAFVNGFRVVTLAAAGLAVAASASAAATIRTHVQQS